LISNVISLKNCLSLLVLAGVFLLENASSPARDINWCQKIKRKKGTLCKRRREESKSGNRK
jgi:hypothetical protein